MQKIVTGVNNQDIQRKLLLERNLTLDKAIQLATSIQQSSDAAKSLAHPTINAIERTPKRKFNLNRQQSLALVQVQLDVIVATAHTHLSSVNSSLPRATSVTSKAILLKPACQRLHLHSRLLASPGRPIISDNTMLIFTTAIVMTKVRRNPVLEQSSTSFPCLHLHIPLSNYPF